MPLYKLVSAELNWRNDSEQINQDKIYQADINEELIQQNYGNYGKDCKRGVMLACQIYEATVKLTQFGEVMTEIPW